MNVSHIDHISEKKAYTDIAGELISSQDTNLKLMKQTKSDKTFKSKGSKVRYKHSEDILVIRLADRED